MTYENDPPRLRVSGDRSDPFVLALEAARMELPSPEALEALAARLTDGRGLGAARSSVARTRLRAKSVQAGLFALAAAVGVGATMKLEGAFPFDRALPPAPAPSPSAPPPAPVAPRRVEAKGPVAPRTEPESSAASAPVEPAPQHRAAKAPAHEMHPVVGAGASQGELPASDVDAIREAESTLLGRAHQALSGDPSRAFALTEQHRRDYPSGVLGQESDLIAIEALVGLGRTSEARALGTKFRARYPSSAHLRRLDRLLGDAAAREQ